MSYGWLFWVKIGQKKHSRDVIMGIFLTNRAAPSRCPAIDCLFIFSVELTFQKMTVGKIYAGLLIAENWKAFKNSQHMLPNAMMVSFVLYCGICVIPKQDTCNFLCSATQTVLYEMLHGGVRVSLSLKTLQILYLCRPLLCCRALMTFSQLTWRILFPILFYGWYELRQFH